ncbi:MAG TPA: glycerophosphodiester phosphodiesterase family protein, partial [Geobacteraceae bacterium]
MPATKLIAHRGASHAAPENTLAAFRLAWEEGADGIEADFRLSCDGEIVCLHDPTTRRTGGVELAVAAATLAELRSVDVGKWKGEEWHGEAIPTLREVLAILPTGKEFFIELKSGPEIVPPLAAILAVPSFPHAAVKLLSFDEEVLRAAARLLPGVKRLLLAEVKPGWSREALTTWMLAALERSGADGLACRARRTIDADFVRRLRKAGKEFHVWTV